LSRIGKLLEAAFGKVPIRLKEPLPKLLMSDSSDNTSSPDHDDALAMEVGALHAILTTDRKAPPGEASLETPRPERAADAEADGRKRNTASESG